MRPNPFSLPYTVPYIVPRSVLPREARVSSVINLRFNESPVDLLKNVEAMSAPVSTGNVVVPAIRARDFTFTFKSDAV